ncbi:hypothetical protein JYU34_003198 [Plutella xylostella]|uniref:Uncharacterized protein n=1 Tax=Plutella xylostella TaxID=51655 RepID=A0ABQ7QZG2_PLUXY|nr:hypothetical protein JYU34_003198 [Plutella xylostella]
MDTESCRMMMDGHSRAYSSTTAATGRAWSTTLVSATTRGCGAGDSWCGWRGGPQPDPWCRTSPPRPKAGRSVTQGE